MKNVERQALWWKYAAWTAPFVALAILLGENLLGLDNWIQLTSLIIVVAFIATSVLWWWWALSKIVFIVESSNRIEENFTDLKSELKEIKKNVGNR